MLCQTEKVNNPEALREQPSVSTDRLILRPFQMSDAKDVQRLAGDPEIADTTANIPHPYLDGMAEQWISGHRESFQKKAGATFAITARQEGRLIGAISLMEIDQIKAEMGYWIGKEFWGQGFGTEAAQAMIAFGFRELGLQKIFAMHFSRNPASGRIMQKAGMSHEGCQRQHRFNRGKIEDLELYGILRKEWEALNTSRAEL